MASEMHPLAPHHLPGFIPGPDGSDPMFTNMTILVILAILGLGLLYMKIHALPEHIAHKRNSSQMQLIGILTLLALFTHNNLFWVAAIVLAVVELPAIGAPLASIASSLRSLAGRKAEEDAAEDEIADSLRHLHGRAPEAGHAHAPASKETPDA